MKKFRSFYLVFIGIMENFLGQEDFLEDFEINIVEDIDFNDFYLEKEKVRFIRSKRKGQKQS